MHFDAATRSIKKQDLARNMTGMMQERHDGDELLKQY
jgi:hypothetical protein